MPESAASLEAIDITLQLAAAFGSGAGVMMIDADALRPAYDAYATRIERSIPYWETDAISSVAAMRAMGALAAHKCLSGRRLVITREDVEYALDAVQRFHEHPLARCRITARA
jgi:hypothetical protein